MDIAHGENTTVWIPIDVTHWLPLPPIPVYLEKESPIGVSKLGFKYLKGASKLAEQFVKMGGKSCQTKK
jgi:hypothetical protein